MRISVVAFALATGCGFQGHGEELKIDAAIDARVEVDDVPPPGDALDAPPDVIDAPQLIGGWRKTFTVHGAQVAGTHMNFPVLIDVVDDDLSRALDGTDLHFTDQVGAPLVFEREIFDKAARHLVAWVKIPTLASTSDTPIVLHGGVARTDSQNPAAVWTASYESVYHLDEAGGGTMAVDVAHAHVAQRTNGPLNNQTGAIGTAYSFDGTNDVLRITQNAAFDSIATVGTLSTWINWADPTTNAYQRVLVSSNRFNGDNLGFEWANQDTGGGHYFYPRGPDADQVYNLVSQPFTASAWQYLVVTLDHSTKTVAIYVDGMPRTITTNHVSANWDTVGTLADWNWGGDAAAPFAGKLDEIHIAHAARNANWILTEFRNQKAPMQFYATATAVDE